MQTHKTDTADCPLSIVHSDSNPRRGVTLLLVLGLMTMFALLVVTFMVVVVQYRQTAEHSAMGVLSTAAGGSLTSAAGDTNAALQKLLVGDTDLKSVIGPWSILEDMYGHPVYSVGDRLKGTINSINLRSTPPWENCWEVKVGLDLLLSNLGHTDYTNVPAPLDLAGSVLTISGGSSNLPPKSTRILEYFDLMGTPDVILIIQPINDVPIGDIDSTCEFIINGAPFSGTGPGFLPAAPGDPQLAGTDDAVDTTQDYGFNTTTTGTALALRPNILAPQTDGSQPYKDYLKDVLVMMNTDYTAPDHLHMFLSWFDLEIDTTNEITQIKRVIPSFHRPSLVSYLPASPTWNDIRKIVLRPMPFDHPNFSGSNPTADGTILNALSGGVPQNCLDWLQGVKGACDVAWDVDCDGDGVADAIWIDPGLAIYEDGGKKYKKLVAYLVRDMDGRLNINAHGNYAHTNPGFDGFSSPPTVTGGVNVRGGGNGPAEVRLDLGLGLLNSNTNSEYLLKGRDDVLNINGQTEKVLGRYGLPINDAIPGKPDLTETQVAQELHATRGINPYAYDAKLLTGSGGLPPDFWGQAALLFDTLGNRMVDNDLIANEFMENPYLFNPYDKGNDDPFLSEQMAAILRTQGDVDFTFLPVRIHQLLGELPTELIKTSPFRHHLTARSSDVPSPSRFLGVTSSGDVDWSIYRKVWRIFDGDAQQTTKAAELLNLLPEEIRQGLRVNLNRPSLSDNWVDDGSGAYDHEKGLQERAKFAQEIFYLLLVLCYDELDFDVTGVPQYTEGSVDVITRLAQWSVNLVDFMDPDATMTPFVFSTAPFTTADATTSTAPYDNAGDINTIVTNGTWTPSDPTVRLIWGMEKPEVTITETLATHNRGTADSRIEEVGSAPKPCTETGCLFDQNQLAPPSCSGVHDTDFDQVIRPQGSLFVELYRCGNPERSQLSPEIGDGTNLLDLAKTTSSGSPIWRLAIGEKTNNMAMTLRETNSTSPNYLKDLFNDSEKCSFQPTQWPGTPEMPTNHYGDRVINVERFVWFTDTGTAIPTQGAGCSYMRDATDSPTDVKLEPNSYLVIGPRATTHFLSKEVEDGQETFGIPDTTDSATSINLSVTGLNYGSYVVGTEIKSPKIMIANTGSPVEGLSVSEPLGSSTYQPTDYPSTTPIVASTDPELSNTFGAIPCYKSIFLQRLADPLRAHDPITNPYITVDWSMVDLQIFTSEEDSRVTNPDPAIVNPGSLRFGTRQWGHTGAISGQSPNPWDRNLDSAAYTDSVANLVGSSDTKLHLDATFGYLNKNATPTVEPTGFDAIYKGGPSGSTAFPHFAWNDSPFANALEVMQVPACSASTFGIQFHEASGGAVVGGAKSLGTGHRFSNENSRLGYLLGFEHSDANTGGTINSLNLARFLEWVHVPSRFAGTIAGWTTDGQPIYAYREPGKINLNTVTESAWEGLSNQRNFNGYLDLQKLRSPSYDPTSSIPIDQFEGFELPFRSGASVDLVVDNTAFPRNSTDTTLMRSDGVNNPKMFFEGEANPANMYTTYENVARLSSMTTNRSNVFAVWITVGYFEVENYSNYTAYQSSGPNLSHVNSGNFAAIYPGGDVLGKEKGLDNGTVKRHRAFYLIDRTIPVGFRRGEAYNVMRVYDDMHPENGGVILPTKGNVLE